MRNASPMTRSESGSRPETETVRERKASELVVGAVIRHQQHGGCCRGGSRPAAPLKQRFFGKNLIIAGVGILTAMRLSGAVCRWLILHMSGTDPAPHKQLQAISSAHARCRSVRATSVLPTPDLASSSSGRRSSCISEIAVAVRCRRYSRLHQGFASTLSAGFHCPGHFPA